MIEYTIGQDYLKNKKQKRAVNILMTINKMCMALDKCSK